MLAGLLRAWQGGLWLGWRTVEGKAVEGESREVALGGGSRTDHVGLYT